MAMTVKLGIFTGPRGKVHALMTYTGPWQTQTQAFDYIVNRTQYNFWGGKKQYVKDNYAARLIASDNYIVIMEDDDAA